MRVASNIPGLKTANSLKKTEKKSSNAMTKLASGLRISKASDDAAGLAISEKMRGQIIGLHQAERNIQDGISLTQTAEGGLAEIQNIVQRVRELCVQGSSSILCEEDRESMQLEINQLNKEINNIANNTHFNGIPLLNVDDTGETIHIGDGTPLSLGVGANGMLDLRTVDGYSNMAEDDNQILIYGNGITSSPKIRINNISYELYNNVSVPTSLNGDTYETIYDITGVKVKQSIRIVGTDQNMYEIKYDITNNSGASADIGFLYHIDTMLGTDDTAPFRINDNLVLNENVYTGASIPNEFVVYNHTTNQFLEAKGILAGSFDGINILETPSQFAIGYYNRVSDWDFAPAGPVGDSGYSIKWNPVTMTNGVTRSVNTFYGLKAPDFNDIIVLGGLRIQTGANTGEDMYIYRKKATAEAMGINDISVITLLQAQVGIGKADAAIKLLSSERAKYGAYQNALEHIYNNAENYSENMSAAESRIRDADMAKEIMNLSKNNILNQAAQSILAQANQVPEIVLQLLK